MRLLIVNDNSELAEITAELLRWIDQPAGSIESISIAGDLATALHLLPRHDVVLCDGEFPDFPASARIEAGWDVVLRHSLTHGIRFILYSGCPRAVEEAHFLHVPSLSKPAEIEDIYSAVTAPYPENQGMPLLPNSVYQHHTVVRR